MASAPFPLSNPLGPQIPGAQGQGPTGYPVAQPGFMPPPPPPGVGFDPEMTPPSQEVYQIDPLVLDRPVKIKIEGSSRMLARAGLQQLWPFIAQATLNGPFLQGLAQQGLTADFQEFMRMAQDAVGTTRLYKLFRQMTPQEQQARSQPSPDAQLKAQIAQQQDQVRLQIMDKKVQGDQLIAQIEAELKNKQIDEESARKILELIRGEHSDLITRPNPQQEMQMHQMDLQAKSQEHRMKLQHQQQEGQMKLQQQAHKMRLDAVQAHMKTQQQTQNTALTGRMQAHNILAQGVAKAQAARMQPKKPQGKSQ